MRKPLRFIALLVVIAVFAVSAVLAAAPSWTVVSVDSIGCATFDTAFTMELAGVTDPTTLRWRTIVDAGGNRYMDEDARGVDASDNGPWPWRLYDDNSGGPVTASFPLPPDTPITVQLLLIDGVGGPTITGTVVTFDKCNGGSAVSIVPWAAPSASCSNPLPESAVVRSLPQGAPAFHAPELGAATGFNIPAGTWYVTQTSGDFTQLWIACEASRVWVPSNAVGP